MMGMINRLMTPESTQAPDASQRRVEERLDQLENKLSELSTLLKQLVEK
jgi:uncharacterized protein YceH (UPF0502 family)